MISDDDEIARLTSRDEHLRRASLASPAKEELVRIPAC